MQTDTVFGLICNGTNSNAIEKIRIIKHRDKPSFSFFVKDLNIAKQYAEMNEIQQKYFLTLFPGHFTIILPASDKALSTMPENVFGTSNIDNRTIKTIGLRIPSNSFCLKVLNHFNVPLLATSANISGKQTPRNINEIDKTIIEQVDEIYYNKIETTTNISSTIIDLVDTNNAKIIRYGSGDIKKLLFK